MNENDKIDQAAQDQEDIQSMNESVQDRKIFAEIKKQICKRCDSDIDKLGNCTDGTCPFSDCQQDDPKGWIGHPQEAEMTRRECKCGGRIDPISSLGLCDNCIVEAASREHVAVNYCPDSTDGKHAPDFETLTKAEIAQPDHWIMDVNCKHCGRSGAFRLDPQTEIDW